VAVRQRGRAWQADVWSKGSRIRRDFATKEEAEKFEASHKARKAKVQSAAPADRPFETGNLGLPPRTLGEAMRRTFNHLYLGSKWADVTERRMVRVVEFFGPNTPMSEIDTLALDRYLQHMRERSLSASTINTNIGYMKVITKFVKERWPEALAELPKTRRLKLANQRVRWMTPEEEARVLALFRQWGKHDHADVLIVAVDTGLRPSELYALRPTDIDAGRAGRVAITVGRTERRGKSFPTKNNSVRTVFATARVTAILARRMGAAKGGLLFPFDNFWFRAQWDRARSVMGLDGDPNFIPYILRHTCASRMVQRGVNLAVIQRWMGHANITMTMRYAHVAPDNMEAAASVLDAA
jgi:integrase